jgi:hypothetical protein
MKKYWYYVAHIQLVVDQKNESFLLSHKVVSDEELFPLLKAIDLIKILLDAQGRIGPAGELRVVIENHIHIDEETFKNLRPPKIGVEILVSE